MSSSAFTPTTTQVTTEVPVNVPVVTAWQSYTPTYAAGAPTGTTLLGQWRRNGDTLEAKVRIQGSASSALSASTTSISWLPSASLTIDTTKLYSRAADRGWIGFGNAYGSFNDTTYTAAFAEPDANPANIGILLLKTVTNASSYLRLNSSNFASTALNAADRYIELYVSAPIVQWSSGVTTLADRALEEYAWNSDETGSANTTSFSYGTDGVLFPNITTFGTPITKRVRFQSAIQTTDKIVVEYQPTAGATWIDSNTRFSTLSQSSAAYGIQINTVNSTDINVVFNAAGVAGGPTYGANGDLWSTYRGLGFKWRVRKVSGGAQVGYPVSARNIVGDTSGTAVPTGMLGETIEFTGSNVAASLSNSGFTCISGYSVPAGKWLITGNCHLVKGTGTGITYLLSGINTSNAAPANYNTTYAVNPTEAGLQTNSLIVDSNGSSQIFMRAQYDFSAVGSSVVVGRLQLVRIA